MYVHNFLIICVIHVNKYKNNTLINNTNYSGALYIDMGVCRELLFCVG